MDELNEKILSAYHKSIVSPLFEAKKIIASAYFSGNVLKWTTKDGRSGSDPMSNKTDTKDVLKHLKKVLGGNVDLDMIKEEKLDEASVDQGAADELSIYVDNDSNLYRQMVQPWQKNLILKIAKGQFKYSLAIKGLSKNLFTEGAKRYSKDYGSGNDWNTMFTVPTREAASKIWLDAFLSEAEIGNYDDLLPKKYQKDGTRNIDFSKLSK